MMIFPGICSLAQHGSQADLLLKQAINYLIRNIFKNKAPISLPHSSCRCCCVCGAAARGDWPPRHAGAIGCAAALRHRCCPGRGSQIGVCLFINPGPANASLPRLNHGKTLQHRELIKRRYLQKATLQ